jgi:putative endonuclease
MFQTWEVLRVRGIPQERRRISGLFFQRRGRKIGRPKFRCAGARQIALVSKEPFEPGAYVYIVKCADGTLYTGWSSDVESRVAAHNKGNGARYTAGRRPVTLVYAENCGTKSAAMKREHQIKRCSRAQKLALFVGQNFFDVF